MPITARKVASTGAPIGGLTRANFKGGESFELNGYWMHPSRRANIEVPIFQHAFYPTLKMTDMDVEKNIDYRNVVVPSIADLHRAGIEADKAVFVAETWIHPRYIKHGNFFRGEFPASIKTLAKQSDIVFVFPASDMPFARLKRKQVLNYYRAAFTPLLIQGSHYTSGRMKFFFAAPPRMTGPMRRSMNLESLDEAWQHATHPLLKGKLSRLAIWRKKDTTENKIVQKELKDVVLPVVSSQLGVPLTSAEGRKLAKMMDSPRMSKDLIKATTGKLNRFAAVKRWVSQTFYPRLKHILLSETGAALESGARYAVRLAISVAFDRSLDKLKNLPDPAPGTSAKRSSKWRSSVKRAATGFHYDMYDTGTIGGGHLSFRKQGALQPSPEVNQRVHEVKMYVLDILMDSPGLNYKLKEVGVTTLLNMFKVIITGSSHAVVSLDDNFIEATRRTDPDALGAFSNPSELARIKPHLRPLSDAATAFLRAT